ncbi:MAG TPA: DnaJ C-terminal domain-containing protein [Tepidisphaeraceae bacterium]|jgi:DnaJ-class molecular chaperone|nr:DnaJ C-terminal domain-containing protein [Tepidisphaeraceae bacterium]
MAKRDYYEVLGVSKTAAADEIRKSHRKLVRQYHPDVNKNNKAAEEKFKEVQEAYDVLSDEHKRKGYDQFGHAGPGAGPGGVDPATYEAYRRAQQGRGRQQWGSGGVTVEDFDPADFAGGGNAGFGDIFEQLFGAGGRAGGGRSRGRAPQPPPMPGSDIEYPISLSFEDAARGIALPLQIRRGGQMESIEIKIPPGVKDGSRVRIKGKGDQGTNGQNGDLYIITGIHDHPYFRRDGLDVLVDVPISLYEALLGTKVEVPTLDGPVTLTIPPGTSSGAKMRIKSRGIERGKEKGDEYVVVKIIVPKDLDASDKEAIAKLQEKHPINARGEVKW